MLTFDEALRIVKHEYRAQLDAEPGPWGTFMIADWGFEDDESFSIVLGMKEYIVDGDSNYGRPVGSPSLLVCKRTGKLSYVSFVANMARFHAMTPVGAVPAEWN
jgi:hypothetical protein